MRDEMNPQHALKPDGWADIARFGVMRLNDFA